MKRFHSFKSGLVIASAAMVLTGCATSGHRYSEANDGYPSDAPDLSNIPNAVPRNEPHTLMGNAPTYEVLGKVYHVLPSAEGYDRVGIASFYGTKFNGYHTSDGEVYNMYAMTAASKVLPLPTYAKVTNLENGRSVIVRVNDRGPFNSRIMDLSYAAATKLGYVRQGTARVRVQAINPETWHQSSESGNQTEVAQQATTTSTPATETTASSAGSSGDQATNEHLTSDSAGQLMASTAGASPQSPSGNSYGEDERTNVAQGTAANTSDGTSADLSSSTASQLMNPSAGQATSASSASSASSDTTSATAGVYLQAIAVTDEAQAEQIRQRLSQALGVQGRIVPFRQYFRVQMGPFNENALSQARAQLGAQGYPGAILIR